MKKLEKEIKLFGEKVAIIKIVRGGQNPPWKNDEVFCVGEIKLPAAQGELADEISFGQRVMVLDNCLTPHWGGTSASGCRFIEYRASGKTWKTAFSDAEKHLDAELKKLTSALRIRKKALKNAEK